MISTLTGRKIGQVERVDKTCFGDEAPELARWLVAAGFATETRDGLLADEAVSVGAALALSNRPWRDTRRRAVVGRSPKRLGPIGDAV
jgi:hypothetical protein